MRDIDPTLMEQVFHIPQRKRISDVHHHRQTDDLGGRLEVAKYAGGAHTDRLAALLVSGKPIFL